MPDLSTAYPQVVLLIPSALALLVSLAALWFSVKVYREFSNDFPGKSEINRVRGEVADFSGQIADLADRFSRFQKREGMRVAREEKETQRSLREQAQEVLAAQGAPDTATGKAALYKRLGGLQ